MTRKIRKKNKIDSCTYCGKEFIHFKWDNQFCCSRECHYKKLKIEVNCCVCNKPTLKCKSNFKRNEDNYCSRDCYNNRRKDKSKKIKRHTKYYNDFLNIASCECGESRKYLLQIHHIDGNNQNNYLNNLEVVCANCHVKRHLKLNKKGELVYHPKSLTDRELLKSL